MFEICKQKNIKFVPNIIASCSKDTYGWWR